MTAGEKLIAQGIELGHAKGRDEGRNEGRVEGRAAILSKQITLRFGTPSPEILARLQTASVEELDCWAEAILTAPTVEALLAETVDRP